MRTSLWIAIVLLAITLGSGLYTAHRVEALSERYLSAAEELQVMTAAQQWQRADETVQAYMSSWTKTVPWLQMLINHDDADDVTLALKRLQAGIKAQDVPLCLESCAELRESAEHLYHRDAFTPGNVL